MVKIDIMYETINVVIGQQDKERLINDSCTDDAITLLAACYMHINLSEDWQRIIEILDFGGK